MRCLIAFVVAMAASASWAESRLQSKVSTCFDRSETQKAAEICVGISAEACMKSEPGGYSNMGMVSCVNAETAAWDLLLNREYKAAQGAARRADGYEADARWAVRAQRLKEAQRAWITYRDAKCASEGAVWGIGTMRSTSVASCLMEMTARRTIELRTFRQMLEG